MLDADQQAEPRALVGEPGASGQHRLPRELESGAELGDVLRVAAVALAFAIDVGDQREVVGDRLRVGGAHPIAHYAGVVSLPAAFEEGVDPAGCAGALAHATDAVLAPDMDIAAVMVSFDEAQSDELAVVEKDAGYSAW